MKLVHVCQYYNDGYGYQENLLPQYQSLLGHNVVLITSDRMSGFIPEKKRVIGSKTYFEGHVKIIRLPIKWEFKGRFVIFKGLYETIAKEKPDYIFHHGLNAPSLLEVVKYKRFYDVLLAVDNHSDINISGKNILWRLFYYQIFWKNILKKLYDYIDVIFGVTPLRCDFPVKYLGAPKEKIRFLPIGLDLKNIPSDSSENLRRKFGFNNNEVLFITGGKITPDKKISKILKAFNILCNDFENIKLVIFGKILDEEVENLLKSNDKIIFLGWKNRKETLEILKMSDVAIWNSKHTTLIEDALATENVLLLRYYGSTAHFIDNNGLYLYSNSVKEIYEKLRLIMENRELLFRFKKASKKLINILSYENVAKESIEYYYDLSPKFIHNYFMNERFLEKDYKNYERII